MSLKFNFVTPVRKVVRVLDFTFRIGGAGRRRRLVCIYNVPQGSKLAFAFVTLSPEDAFNRDNLFGDGDIVP